MKGVLAGTPSPMLFGVLLVALVLSAAACGILEGRTPYMGDPVITLRFENRRDEPVQVRLRVDGDAEFDEPFPVAARSTREQAVMVRGAGLTIRVSTGADRVLLVRHIDWTSRPIPKTPVVIEQ